MASGIDSATSALILAAMNGGTAVTFTTPLVCQWLSAVRTTDTGTDTVVSGVSFSGLTFAAATAGAPSTQSSNVAATVTNVPAFTWAGNRIIDSAGTPKTTFWAGLTASKSVNAGDTVSIASGSWSTSLG